MIGIDTRSFVFSICNSVRFGLAQSEPWGRARAGPNYGPHPEAEASRTQAGAIMFI